MHIAMMLSFVISVKGKEEVNLYYLYYSRTLIKVIYSCLWTWVNMLLKWKTRAKPKFFISLSFIFCKMEKEIFCYNPLEIYHSIQSRAFVCHFFFLRKQTCCFYNNLAAGSLLSLSVFNWWSLAWYLTETKKARGKGCFWQRTANGKKRAWN